MTGQEVQEGDRVRSVYEETFVSDRNPPGRLAPGTVLYDTLPPGSMATVTCVGSFFPEWVDVEFDDAPKRDRWTSLAPDEYEWVERPVPPYPLQRRCDAECYHS